MLTYDAQDGAFRVADDSGMVAGVGCNASGNTVFCPDPTGEVREIYVVLKGERKQLEIDRGGSRPVEC